MLPPSSDFDCMLVTSSSRPSTCFEDASYSWDCKEICESGLFFGLTPPPAYTHSDNIIFWAVLHADLNKKGYV